jgi:amidophosphoribosyltransferase
MCGVFGVWQSKAASLGPLLFYGLYALQHRGQESCGLAVYDHQQLALHKEMGLVNQVFTEALLPRFVGEIGLGQVRYSTTGKSHLENAQPVVVRSPLGAITLAHNGNLINTLQLKAELEAEGFYVPGDSDSLVMATIIQQELQRALQRQAVSLPDAVTAALRRCKGAFSVLIATGDTLMAARDEDGLRPLCLGKAENGGWILASETCALDIVGATFERDIRPGELWTITQPGLEPDSRQWVDHAVNTQDRLCIFEMVYFARPDSRVNEQSVYNYRLALGKRLAETSPPIQADIVIPVPDSGNVAAVGYSRQSGIPYVEGLIKNRYVGRTFINPIQELREQGIKLKLNPMPDVLEGKSVVVVDDSIVRGNTSRKLVKMLKDAGAKEVHLRISSAPVKYPCFYGIDMSDRDELIANQMTLSELQTWLGCESLVYLDAKDMQAIANNHRACAACFTGEYPAGTPTTYAESYDALHSTASV